MQLIRARVCSPTRSTKLPATTRHSARKRRVIMRSLILIPLTFLWVQAAVAASPIIVDGHYVAEAIERNAVVWDVRAADAYAQGHIAGAISIGDAARVLRDDNTEDFITIDRIEKILGAAGLDATRQFFV